MVYEILVRGKNRDAADNLISIASDLPSRAFEAWLVKGGLLGASVVRWSIVPNTATVQFNLQADESAIHERVAQLVRGVSASACLPNLVKRSMPHYVKPVWASEAAAVF